MSKFIKAGKYLLLLLTCIAFLFPLAWCAVCSIKPENDIASYPPMWIPKVVTLENYTNVLRDYPYLDWAFNSAVVTIVSTLLILVCSSLAAYAFGRFHFKFKKLIYTIVIIMLLIPIQAYVVPLYLVAVRLHLTDTYASIILANVANVTSIFILTSFFKGLPNELEEAARLDGCSEFGIFLKIMFPLAKPALSTVTILVFISSWNNFLWPMITIRTNTLKPLPVGIAQFMGSATTSAAFHYGISLAAACMAVIPTIIVFLLLQRYFVEGIAHSGIKG